MRMHRKRPRPPYASWLLALVIAALVVVVIGLATAGQTSLERRQTPLHHRSAGPPSLDVRDAGSLPAAIQDASSAPLSGGAVALLGGLDAAGSSRTAIIRVADGRAAPLGAPPTPLHDATATPLRRSE